MNPQLEKPAAVTYEQATLGGGCFWCLEAVFELVRGVGKVVSGYAGGSMPDPSYQQVCSGTTGHAEVVQITFDPARVSFRDLLNIFFTTHDPTTLDRQGADVGTQYRSAIFYHNPSQKQIAEDTIKELTAAGLWKNPIVTQIAPLDIFYAAEDYHQGYFRAHPGQSYCRAVIDPKVAKFRKSYQSLLQQP
jgi:peptide-methionine (S)-S-oxide reductase